MKKTFISNLILVLALNLSIKPFFIFAIDRKVQNIVGLQEYGIYYALFSFSYIFNVILDFGITNFNNRNISQNTHLLTKHFSRIVILKLALAIVYLIICTLTGLVIGYNFKMMKLLFILCFMQFLISFIFYLRSNISGMHLFRTDSVLSTTDRMIAIALCVPFLWGHFFAKQIDIMDYVYIQLTSYLLVAIIAFAIVAKKAGFIKFEWKRTFSMMILKRSFPFALLGMIMSFYNRIDGSMLERLIHDDGKTAGIYAQAFRLLDATNMIGVLAAGLLLPIFARMLKLKESVESIVKTAYTLLFALAIVVACGCAFYSYDMMKMLYAKDVSETAAALNETSVVFALLMCCFLGSATQYVFGTLLTANGNLKYLNIIAACGFIVNITLNLILIPRLYAVGAAIAGLTTQLLVPTIEVFVVRKMFGFTMIPKLMLSLLIFAIGEIIINYFLSHYFLQYNWIVRFAGMIALSGIWILATGLLNVKSVLSLVKSKS